MQDRSTWLATAITSAVAAGKAVLDVYASTDMRIEKKTDDSPLTLADRRSHNIITTAMGGFGIPVLSEEGRDIPFEERSAWPRMWIVTGGKKWLSAPRSSMTTERRCGPRAWGTPTSFTWET